MDSQPEHLNGVSPCECGSCVADECGFCGRCGCYRPDCDRKVGVDDDVLEAAASERAEAFKEVVVDG